MINQTETLNHLTTRGGNTWDWRPQARGLGCADMKMQSEGERAGNNDERACVWVQRWLQRLDSIAEPDLLYSLQKAIIRQKERIDMGDNRVGGRGSGGHRGRRTGTKMEARKKTMEAGGVDGKSEHDEEETKGGEEDRVGVRDVWCVFVRSAPNLMRLAWQEKMPHWGIQVT